LIVRVLAAAHQPSGDETLGVSGTEHPHQGNLNAPDGKNPSAGAEDSGSAAHRRGGQPDGLE
jgi:hypothetical protein